MVRNKSSLTSDSNSDGYRIGPVKVTRMAQIVKLPPNERSKQLNLVVKEGRAAARSFAKEQAQRDQSTW